MKTVLWGVLGLWAFSDDAQGLPTDYLPADFHKERREAVRQMMPPHSVAVFFANPVRNRANDVDYVYHQDPDFYYLTGYPEPHAILVLFSEPRSNAQGTAYDEMLFVQERNPQEEQWTGKRLGVDGAKEKLGFSQVFNGGDFKDAAIDFKTFDKVLFLGFQEDYRDGSDPADMYDLIRQFKQKIDYPADYNPDRQRLYGLIQATETENSANVAQTLGRYMDRNAQLQSDQLLTAYRNAADDQVRKEIKGRVSLALKANNLDTSTLGGIMDALREQKDPREMALLRKAISISAVGQIEVMKAMHPEMSEMEVQGLHEYVYKKYGAEYEGYPSIVGGGHNGCILHYIENSKTQLGKDLVLMDLGAEYHGYTADVTRTIPANGRFGPEQKAIYQIVYDAQEAGIRASVAGAPFAAPHRAAYEVVAKGLIDLGIIQKPEQARTYFPHGTSHYLGLDVHDRGIYDELRPNAVITVEPGIYIPEGSDCDPKWWGIAVRIEDDILITEAGPENLSAAAPRTIEAIEATMGQSSPLDAFTLPKLD